MRALVARALGETVYRRLMLVERELGDGLLGEVPPELEVGFLDASSLDEYEELRPGRGTEAAARLATGHRCFGTRVDGRLVAVRWLATGSPHVGYLDLRLPLSDDEIYHYDSFTHPEQRRRGLSLSTQAALFALLRDEGFRHVLRAVLPENRAAVGDAAKAGYRPLGRMGYVRLGRWRRTFVRRSAAGKSGRRPD